MDACGIPFATPHWRDFIPEPAHCILLGLPASYRLPRSCGVVLRWDELLA